MLLAPLPFDYIALLDSGDRLRRTRTPATGSRVRRLPAGKPGE
jgi:hypothetical protein